jgi:hypothetical protein
VKQEPPEMTIMGLSFKYAKQLAKLGTKLMILLLVVDTAWSLIRFIIFRTACGGICPEQFITIDNLITNLLFTIFLTILVVGIVLLSVYYRNISRLGIPASILLLIEIGFKVTIIIFRFSQLLGDYYGSNMMITINICEMVSSILFILSFIVFDLFQNQLKRNKEIGLGWSPIPYLFAAFALIYPINNILTIVNSSYEILYPTLFAIFRTLAYIATIIEIILFFDLLRRFDNMTKMTKDGDSEPTINLQIKKRKRKKEMTKTSS